MPESAETAKEDLLTTLLKAELSAKDAAIAGYNNIIWKIRAGYAAVLYGGLGLAVGEKGAFKTAITEPTVVVMAALLVLGFSLVGFLLDRGYTRKKLRVVIAKDTLLDAVLKGHEPATMGLKTPSPTWELSEKERTLLKVSGEAELDTLEEAGCNIADFKTMWRRERQLMWILYGVAPFLMLWPLYLALI